MGLAAGVLSPGKLKNWMDKMDGDVENYVDLYNIYIYIRSVI